MSNMETRWDIGEQVVQRVRSARPLSGIIASSAVHVVFSVLAIGGSAAKTVQMSDPTPALRVVRLERMDLNNKKSRSSDGSDTRQGMSTGRLAKLFPVLFQEAEAEEDSEPFLLD
jgi:hypothetical protein